MGRIPLTFLTIAVSGLAGTTSLASADTLVVTRTVHVFEAHLQDSACGNNTFCGAGKLTGFGRVKTRAAFRPAGAPPAAGCLAVAGTRRLTLVSNRKSTLRLAVKGAACGSRSWGTFKVSSGSGVFAGATGSGVILGSFTQTRHEYLHYSGVLTLAH